MNKEQYDIDEVNNIIYNNFKKIIYDHKNFLYNQTTIINFKYSALYILLDECGIEYKRKFDIFLDKKYGEQWRNLPEYNTIELRKYNEKRYCVRYDIEQKITEEMMDDWECKLDALNNSELISKISNIKSYSLRYDFENEYSTECLKIFNKIKNDIKAIMSPNELSWNKRFVESFV